MTQQTEPPAPHIEPPRWRWDGGLAERFDAHAVASIPMYAEMHALAVELSAWFVCPGSTVYDLGASTGTLAVALGARHPSARVIGVDAEPQMVATAHARCDVSNVTFEIADVRSLSLQPCSFVALSHLTPFLTGRERAALLARTHDALTPGGATVIFEKTLPQDAKAAAIAHSALISYKLAHGLSPAAIIEKEQSLRGVMQPRARTDLKRELHTAGFEQITSVFRWLNWDGYLAIKAAA